MCGRGLDTDYAAMHGGRVLSNKSVGEIRREHAPPACGQATRPSKKPHKINLNTCSDSGTTPPVETGETEYIVT